MCCGFDIFQNMKSPLKQWPLCQPPPIQIDTVNPPTDQSSINQSVHWPSRTLDYYRRSLSRCCTAPLAPRPPLQCHCSQWGISIAVSGQFDLAFLNHRHIHIHVHVDIACPRRDVSSNIVNSPKLVNLNQRIVFSGITCDQIKPEGNWFSVW